MKKRLYLLTVILCFMLFSFCAFSAGAEGEWIATGDIEFRFDEETATMTVRGQNADIAHTDFTIVKNYRYCCETWYDGHECGEEGCECPDKEHFGGKGPDNITYHSSEDADVYEPDAQEQIIIDAAENTKVLIIEQGVRSLKPMALSYLAFPNLKIAVLPESITEIPDCAFYNQKNLESVIISYNTKRIGVMAFGGCEKLRSICIPQTVESIGDNAFFGCDSRYIVLPESCKNSSAFVTPDMSDFSLGLTYKTSGEAYLKATGSITMKNAAVGGGDGIVVYERNSKGKHTELKTVEKYTGSYKAFDGEALTETLTPGEHSFAVKVFKNFADRTEYSDYYYYDLFVRPGATSKITATSPTTTSIKLTWNKVAGADGYTVYRWSPSKDKYVKAGETENTSLTVSKLYTGTKYTFKVIAYGKSSDGDKYESYKYTLIKTATKTATPTLSKVTSSSKGKATLTHTNVSGETGYTVYYSTKKDSGFKKYANFKADTKTCNITGLTSGKTYYFKVRTYIKTDSGYVYSPWSAVKGIKVK